MVGSGECEEGETMFLGEYQHSLDAKGRLIIPAKFREQMGEKCFLTLGLDGCIFLFPQSEWEALSHQVTRLPLTSKGSRDFSRRFFASANEFEFDKQGRILLPPKLLKELKFDKDVSLVGVSNRVEIWPRERWEATYEDNEENSYEQLAELIADIGLSF